MALYVQYTPDVYPQSEGSVLFWLFPEEFSQSRLGDRELGSNACTLIAVLTAAKIQVFKIPIWGYPDQPLSRILVSALAESIVEGNEIYENLAISGQLTDPNLDISEALGPVREKFPLFTEWPVLAMNGRENIIREPMGQTLSSNIHQFLVDWVYNPPIDKIPNSDLFIILVANTRTCLFVCQPQLNKISLIDSHAHHPIRSGAVVAQARVGDVDHLCEWFCAMSLHCYGAGPDIDEYELSCMYMQDIGLYDLNEET